MIYRVEIWDGVNWNDSRHTFETFDDAMSFMWSKDVDRDNYRIIKKS